MKITRLIVTTFLSILVTSETLNANVNFYQEWLDTNGLGSVISGTVGLANSRNYHAHYIVVNEKGERITLVNNIEVEVTFSSNEKIFLSSNHYGPNTVFPNGQNYITQFSSFPIPTWTFQLPNNISITKEIFYIYKTNTVIVRYKTNSNEPIQLTLRPLMTGRSYFGIRKDYPNLMPQPIETASDNVQFLIGSDLPAFCILHSGKWNYQPYFYYNQYYPLTAERSEEPYENLWSPGAITYSLDSKHPALLKFDLKRNTTRNFDEEIASEIQRRESLKAKMISSDKRIEDLAYASNHFLFTRPDNKESVLAGFPWFLDWGRDTFISLEGLLLIKNDLTTARQILSNFAKYEKNGLLPNMFPTLSNSPAYNSVDAPLWFIHAAFKTLDYGETKSNFINELWPTIKNILNNYIAGTSFNIKADPADGLVYAGSDGLQLTWMDAKVGDYVVTPRRGKPIEINSLWYESLSKAIEFASIYDDKETNLSLWQRYEQLVKNNFKKKFFDSSNDLLRDVIDAEDSLDQIHLRPNALYALALTPQLFLPDEGKRILKKIEQNLLTPLGLRSLAPDDPMYIPYYTGNLQQRDAAYHQGTVWSFLIGVYVDAVLNFNPQINKEVIEKQLLPLLLHSTENATNVIAEIFDGNSPHKARGTFAQAWSSAELLRAYYRLGLLSPAQNSGNNNNPNTLKQK